MSTISATGFCRVTVVAPDSRIDVALPDDLPVADLRPDILRLSGQVQTEEEPTGFHLVRRDGSVLDPALSLSAQRVLDGELIALRAYAESLPPAVHDDVADAIATAVVRDRRRWDDDLMRVVGLTGGAVLLVMMGFVLWWAEPIRHDMHSMPGVVAGVLGTVLVAFAAVRARIYRDRVAAVALGLAALPHLLIAGSGIVAPDHGHGPGRLQFMVGCATVLVASAILVAVLPTGDAPFVASAFLAAAGTLATYGAIATDAPPRGVASVAAVAAVALVGFLPGWSARFARLPIGFGSPEPSAEVMERYGDRREPEQAIDYEAVAAQARRGHELLLGLVGGCAATVVGAAAVMSFSDSAPAQVLALTAGVAALLRARLFRYTSQVASLVVAGILAVALLILGLALNPDMSLLIHLARGDHGPLDLHTLWLSAAIAAGAVLLVAIGLIVPRKGVSPFWGRSLDLAEGAVLLSLVPLCLGVLKVYGSVRGLSSD
ncbi:type VII secretion integral membrane protein EccD [Actinacidiphila bryophytorum]|uniref:Type VII secretion integral membrane protein EccD n=1 Tax=Actinacidiphila bryophytorum TaxID=1436133 RepID=A0A9W4GYB4_9ACTN|nr:type VII secretion integral membrane protein EccD [Actinacidiphila bryophytorum]MBM9435638.1 type VII secretion integral membrane protein EccD [Actinacidiphila bryophytorum]MBN6543324.1 type VII secretion integral membrane protein EccD [Actinacidiphila bryophytorum]UWE11864.1 type VII secretion integral membrane protein EccD [Actinacidiphila bryophytorum]CAG7610243.1 Type VII secretion integral membrane protein EccD [Actinacidiphila bryophytorum]